MFTYLTLLHWMPQCHSFFLHFPEISSDHKEWSEPLYSWFGVTIFMASLPCDWFSVLQRSVSSLGWFKHISAPFFSFFFLFLWSCWWEKTKEFLKEHCSLCKQEMKSNLGVLQDRWTSFFCHSPPQWHYSQSYWWQFSFLFMYTSLPILPLSTLFFIYVWPAHFSTLRAVRSSFSLS